MSLYIVILIIAVNVDKKIGPHLLFCPGLLMDINYI